MKIALLAGANVIHTTRWANGLTEQGHQVHLITAHPLSHRLDARVKLVSLPVSAPWGYVLGAPALRRVLHDIQPDILNAHYASGYGLLARLSGFRPCLLSVWGSDVYDFPKRSRWHLRMLRANLRAASAIASTSHCMSRVVQGILPGATVYVTHFGVDVDRFRPSQDRRSARDTVVVGTVKTLAGKYGVDVLIRAFAIAHSRLRGELDLRLQIAGGGPDFAKLQALVRKLNLSESVRFLGRVPHDEVPRVLGSLDVYAALSRLDSESFGVAVLEASSCGLPVVVSNVDGLAEVAIDGRSGLIVPKEDASAAAEALIALARNEALRRQMGDFGRRQVTEHYSWSSSVEDMLGAYQATVAVERGRRRAESTRHERGRLS